MRDYDAIPDDKFPNDSDRATDNVVGVTLKQAGKKDECNSFVDTDTGSISGSVTDDDGNTGNPLVDDPSLQLLVAPDNSINIATLTGSSFGDW